MLGRIGFAPVHCKVRRGLSGPARSTPEAQKLGGAADRRAWGSVCLLTPAAPRPYLHCPKLYAAKGELDLIGFDGDTLALIELSITQGKHETLIRTAHYFLRERHIKEHPLRSDVVAIDNTPGQPPVVRLQKSALSPFVHRYSDR